MRTRERTSARRGARRIGVLACLGAVALSASVAQGQSVCTPDPGNPTAYFTTSLGVVEVLLCRADVQATVDNFVQYVEDGAYTDTGFMHRSRQPTQQHPDRITIVQGGGAWVDAGGGMRLVETRDPIALEALLPNVRGTIAMARTGDPDSATSQWFFNVLDNPALDAGAGADGFAVFGEVTAGLDVLDDMASKAIWSLNESFLEGVPLDDYPDDGSSVIPYLIYVTDVQVVPEPGAAPLAAAALGTLAVLARRRLRAGAGSR